MKKRHLSIVLVSSFAVISCGQPPQPKAVVAYVNKEPIFESELKKIMGRRSQQDPSYAATPADRQEQLEFMIDKKLIIQEALERGLASDKEFVDSIKSYWEQTLIREFIDYKSAELSS